MGGSTAARGEIPFFPFSGLRGGAIGTVQRPEEPGTQESWCAQPEIFRGPAHSGGSGHGRRRGLRLLQLSHHRFVLVGPVAGTDRTAVIPDGEYLVSLEFQRTE